jgi:general secretion pathway protein D
MGLTIEPAGKFLKIIESPRAKEVAIPTSDGELPLPDGDQFVTRLVRLQHVGADELANVLGRLKGKEADVVIYAPSNTLIITDTASNLERLLWVIGELDIPGGGERIWLIRLRNATATEVGQKLNELFPPGQQGKRGTAVPKLSTSRSSPAVLRADAARAIVAATGKGGSGQETFGDLSVTKILADDRTNTLILIANDRAYQRILALVRKLDVAVEGGEGRVHIYYLENATAEEIAQTLSGLASGSTGAGTAARPARGAKASGATRTGTVQLFEGEVKITADKPTNSLVIVASAKDFLSVREVIRKLDIPRRQVFIEVTILEVALEKIRDLGLSFHGGTTVGSGSNQSLVFGGSAASKTIAPASIIGDATALSGLAAGLIGPEVQGAGQILGNVGVSFPGFGVFLQALQRNNDVDIVSAPTLLTTDNEDAEILVGKNVPFQAGFTPIPTGTSTGTGSYYPFQSIQRQDVALKLKITPHVNESSFVRLQVEQELSDLLSEDKLVGPTTSKRQIKTVVVVRDQQTVVLGGLVGEKTAENTSKVPLLGDIPILGRLFRTTNTRRERNNLLVILTPYIVRDQTDLKRIFERKLAERREFIERYSQFPRGEYEPGRIEFHRKHGLLEEINHVAIQAEDEARQIQAAEKLVSTVEQGPVEVPPGFSPTPEAAGGQPGAAPAGDPGAGPGPGAGVAPEPPPPVPDAVD